MAAAYGIVISAWWGVDLAFVGASLCRSRPKAVNRAWALDRMRSVAPTVAVLTAEAHAIEGRDPAEIPELLGIPIAPPGAIALNLAFDVTPARLITGIITEKGIICGPYRANLARLMRP